jgi:hypothetical protein
MLIRRRLDSLFRDHPSRTRYSSRKRKDLKKSPPTMIPETARARRGRRANGVRGIGSSLISEASFRRQSVTASGFNLMNRLADALIRKSHSGHTSTGEQKKQMFSADIIIALG